MLVEKQQRLEACLSSLGSAVVAFSGGVDSALLLAVAHSVLGKKVLAVTAESESLPERELKNAQQFAADLGVEHLVIRTHEMRSPEYRENSPNRCYHCKSELYAQLQGVARERSLNYIVNGINADDMGDYRPGILSAKEAGVLSPLRDAGFCKDEIRSLSRQLGLAVWDKPAAACLSSRVPYNQPITKKKLSMIENAEDLLLALGFTQVRVRHHGDIARIELLPEEMYSFFEGGRSLAIQKRFKELGFKFVTLDIEGFRSGSMNEALNQDS